MTKITVYYKKCLKFKKLVSTNQYINKLQVKNMRLYQQITKWPWTKFSSHYQTMQASPTYIEGNYSETTKRIYLQIENIVVKDQMLEKIPFNLEKVMPTTMIFILLLKSQAIIIRKVKVINVITGK